MKKTHGESKTKLYIVWHDMLTRCTSSKSSSFKNYGGRGIFVCNEWGNYLVFKDWALKNGYRKDLQIDRIDNDGNYTPENCRFVTRSFNHTNRRKSDNYGIYKNHNCNTYHIRIYRRPLSYSASAYNLYDAIIIRDKMVQLINATERESKYRELVSVMKDLIKLYGGRLSDHAVYLSIHGIEETESNIKLGEAFRQHITELEKELGLNKE